MGDKSERFHVGDPVTIYTGARFKAVKIAQGIITDVQVQPFGDITDKMLKHESPDCKTKEALRCTMFFINGDLVEDGDIVTLITWDYIYDDEQFATILKESKKAKRDARAEAKKAKEPTEEETEEGSEMDVVSEETAKEQGGLFGTEDEELEEPIEA